jgi:hypothetical protein
VLICLHSSSSRLCLLLQGDGRGGAPPNASTVPAAGSSLNDSDDKDNAPEAVHTDDDSTFDGLDWARGPLLERRGKEHATSGR